MEVREPLFRGSGRWNTRSCPTRSLGLGLIPSPFNDVPTEIADDLGPEEIRDLVFVDCSAGHSTPAATTEFRAPPRSSSRPTSSKDRATASLQRIP